MVNIPDLNEIPDLEPVAEGEYNLRITSAQETVSGNTGRSGMLFVISNLDVDNAENIFHRIWFPMEGDEEHKAQTMWRMVKDFLRSLGMSHLLSGGELDPSEFIGMEFSGLVGLQKNNQSGNDENVLKRVTDA